MYLSMCRDTVNVPAPAKFHLFGSDQGGDDIMDISSDRMLEKGTVSPHVKTY
jgi:hypothetical protein